MAAKKKATAGKTSKGRKAPEVEIAALAAVMKKAQEPIVTRYLELFQLSTEGDLFAKVRRLYLFLEARFEKCEPELEHLTQICSCDGLAHALLDCCPFCGSVAMDEDGKKERQKGGGEKAGVAQILSRWPAGFERVVPAPPAAIVKTTPKDVAKKKQSRSEAAAKKTETKLPEPEPPTAEKLAEMFVRILKRHEAQIPGPAQGLSFDSLIAEAQKSFEGTPIVQSFAWQALAQLERGEVVTRKENPDPVDEYDDRYSLAVDAAAVRRIAKEFAIALELNAGEALSTAAMMDAANVSDDVDTAVLRAACLLIVQDGRATRRGQMFQSTKPAPSEADGAEEQAASEAVPSSNQQAEIAAIDKRWTDLPPGMHVVEEGVSQGPATEQELNRVLAEVNRLHGQVVISLYEQGVLLNEIMDRQLYRQRRDGHGNPVYKTFAQFASAELSFGTQHAYKLAQVAKSYTRVQLEDPKLGIRKLTVLLAVKDLGARDTLIEAARAGASASELKSQVDAQKGGAQTSLNLAGAGADELDAEPSNEEPENDGGPRSEPPPRPAAPAKATAPTPSKGPAATPTPREQRITAALVPGRVVLDLLARPGKAGAAPKKAKKIEQDPWVRQELGNGVFIEYRIYAGPGGGLQLAIETSRSNA